MRKNIRSLYVGKVLLLAFLITFVTISSYKEEIYSYLFQSQLAQVASTPVNGVCSTTFNTCTAGTFVDVPDSSTQNLWTCTGSGGGTTDSCSSPLFFTALGTGYIEAESGVLTGTYLVENGSVYNKASDTWTVTYTFNVGKDDNYYISLLAQFNSYYDSFTYTLDGGTPYKQNFHTNPPSSGQYEKRLLFLETDQSNLIPLTPGQHEIKFSNISANVKIDKIRVVSFPDMYKDETPPINTITSGKVFVQNAQLNLSDQDPVVWYPNSTGFVASIRSGLAKASGMVRIPGILKPDTYNIFVNTGGTIQDVVATMGDVSTVKTKTNGSWVKVGTITTTKDSYQLFVNIYKSTALSVKEITTFSGVYITNNLNETIVGGVAVDLSHPVDTGAATASSTSVASSTIVKDNLIQNSGFETGIDANWSFASNKKVELRSIWDNSAYHDGSASIKLPLDPSTGQLIFMSRVYKLKPNKKYTFSFWTKTQGPTLTPGRVILKMMNTFTPPSSAPYPRDISTNSNFTIDSTWSRVSVSGIAINYPTADYQFVLEINGGYTPGVNDYIWMDDVQLEEGDLTDYKPSQDMEVQFKSSSPANIYYDDQSVYADVVAYNSSSTPKSNTLKYEVYDYLNKKVKEGSLSVSLSAKTKQTLTSIDLSIGKRGAFRVVYWLDGVNNSDKEFIYSVVPKPYIAGRDQNSYIGIHTYNLDFLLNAISKLGIKWTRTLSPDGSFRWNFAEPTEGNFVYFDSRIMSAYNSGLEIIGTLQGSASADGSSKFGPTWSKDPSTGLPNLTKWSNFVKAMVSHYKPWVHVWEVWNEPNQVKTATPTFDEAFYAELLASTTVAIESVDPSAKVVAMGGTDAAYMQRVVSILESKYPGWYKAHLDAFSTHAYPGGHRPSDFTSPIIQGLSMPVWNTEAGAWDLGFYQGSFANFISWGVSTNNSERFSKGMLTKPEDLVKNLVETLGSGLTKFFYYDSRMFSSLDSFATHPTIFEYDGTIRPKGVAYAVSAYFLDRSTTTPALGNLGLVSNVSAYLFDRNGVPTLVVWTDDKLNRQLRVSIPSSQYSAYDIMGNLKSMPSGVIEIGRTPIYVVGNGITVSAFKSAIKSSTVENRADILPPSLTISEGPRGTVNDSNIRLRWFALDEMHVPQLGAPDNIEAYRTDTAASFSMFYQYRLVGLDPNWSSWSTDIYKDYKNLPKGSYRFEVKARDGAGNTTEVVGRDFVINSSDATDSSSVSDISGSCSGSINRCDSGYFYDLDDSGSQYLWSCVGSGSGSTALCTSQKPIIKDSVDGLCASKVNTCVTGTFTDLTDTDKNSVWSCDGIGEGVSVMCSMPLPPKDNTPPVIKNVSASSITSDQVTITFTTDEISDTQIEYGLTTAYGNKTTINSVPVLNHSQSVTGLKPNTTYHYRVITNDVAGNVTVSGDYTFTTKVIVTTDSDFDGVVDSSDLCPNTPERLKLSVNTYGCPKPKVTKFNIKPTFDSDISSFANFEIGNTGLGRISLKQSVKLLKDAETYKDELDIDSNLVFAQSKVSLDSAKIPELNKPATITLYNINVINPRILRDGSTCTTCALVSYKDKTVVFTVTGFSTYEVVEGGASYVQPVIDNKAVTSTIITTTATQSKTIAKSTSQNTSTSTSSVDQDEGDYSIFGTGTDYFHFDPLSYNELLDQYVRGILVLIANTIKSLPGKIF